jgi:hypothetical protein
MTFSSDGHVDLAKENDRISPMMAMMNWLRRTIHYSSMVMLT